MISEDLNWNYNMLEALDIVRDQEHRSMTPTGSPELSPKFGLGSLKQKSTRRNPLSLSHESLIILDQDVAPQKLASANSVNSIVNHVSQQDQEQGGRVVGWAISFHRLLTDNIGIAVFTEFLKKEFSEENIEFWKACEEFKSIMDSSFCKCKAKEIYDKYVSMQGSHSVNIDSVIRREIEAALDIPTPQTFSKAQQHIFQLMKQDSYSRFLKADLYKSYMVCEMEGKPLVAPGQTDKHAMLEKDNKKKGKENDERKEKRRRSLLPWRIKSKKPSKESKGEKSKEKEKELKDIKETPSNDLPLNGNAPTTLETTAPKKDMVHVEVPDTISEEPDQPRFCRVIMPDGSTTVVGTKQGQTISYVLGKLCEKRGFSIASVDVFLIGSDKLLNVNEDISTLGSKEVTVERRVLFRMDLPNKKCIGVKAKPNRLIREVFRPILQKYGYKIEDIDVHLSGHSVSLCLEDYVSTIDSQRVIVLASEPTDTNVGKVEMVEASLDMQPFQCTERGVKPEVSGKKVNKKQRKVTFTALKPTDQTSPKPHKDGKDGRASANNDVSQTTPWRPSTGAPNIDPTSEPHDLMSEIDDYIESINENFAAYNRENANTPKRTLAAPNQTPKSALKITNKSFTDDSSIVPSNEQAERLFGNKTFTEGDFKEPVFTEKGLKDIEFTYNHKKYLSKSRNFVTQRKELTQVSPVCVQVIGESVGEKTGEGKTWESEPSHRQLDVSSVNNPLSSPYSSDSSIEPENTGKKSTRSRVLSRTRHTFLHSPTTSDSADNLSTVDTDSHVLHHATPVNVLYSNSTCVPITRPGDSMYASSGDEVTFV